MTVLQARNETAQPFSVDVYVNGTMAGTQSFTAASLTAPDPIVVSAAGREGANTVRLVKKGGGTLYWSARATLLRHRRRAGAQRQPAARDHAEVRAAVAGQSEGSDRLS